MSDVVNSAVEALSAKMDGGFDGSAKFVIEGEGSIVIDNAGVRQGDDDTEVTLTADADTFQSILEGDLDDFVDALTLDDEARRLTAGG